MNISEYTFRPAPNESFAVYHTIYNNVNIFMRFDWSERIEDTTSNVKENGFYVYHSDELIGGFATTGSRISYPFMVPPFKDRATFWKTILAYVEKNCAEDMVELVEITQVDADVLLSLGAKIKWSQRRMCRPTGICSIRIDEDIILASPDKDDLPEIVSVVHQAHSAGYTSTVWGTPDINATHDEIIKRYNSFSQTDSWDMSVVAKRKYTDEIVGVCIAGIYPDTPNNFATIHQVSVLPQYRRRGIAAAMMIHSINAAYPVSPVVTLGVLVGNPAENLYRKLGFLAGPSYSDMIYTA